MTNEEKDKDLSLALVYEIFNHAMPADPEELADTILEGLKKWREGAI